MKKIFFGLLIILLPYLGNTQSNSYNFVFPNNNSYGWQNTIGELNESYCGISGLFTGINRSIKPNAYGNYRYDILMASNSYTPAENGCILKYTYVENVKIYYYDENINSWKYPLYFMKFWAYIGNSNLIYTIYSPHPNLKIKIEIGNYKIIDL